MYGRYSYNSVTGILRFLMPTFIHGSANTWITRWVHRMETLGDIEEEGIEVINDATLKGFPTAYRRR